MVGTVPKRILLLGASGFVGSSIRSANLESRFATSYNWNFASSQNSLISGTDSSKWCTWDVTTKSSLTPNFDIILHAATPASALLNYQDPKEMFNLNVSAMRNILDFASKHDSPPTVVLTSSGAVYGPRLAEEDPVPEWTILPDLPQGATSAYAEGKRAAEGLLMEGTNIGICKGIISRLFAFSGKHLPRDRHFAIGNFVESAITTKKIVVRSDGSSIRSYLDELDMAQWLMSICENGVSNHIYHVGSERVISIRDLAFLVARRCEFLTGENISVEILGETSPIDGVSRYIPSTTQTRNELGLSETISLESSIDNMLQDAIASHL